jgi:hypothetical protein
MDELFPQRVAESSYSCLTRAIDLLVSAPYIQQDGKEDRFTEPPTYGSLPAIDPRKMTSPRPPSGLCLKMGKIACVMLITPIILVAYTSRITSCGMSGDCSMPDMKPLVRISIQFEYGLQPLTHCLRGCQYPETLLEALLRAHTLLLAYSHRAA